jgi:hypothetical protein
MLNYELRRYDGILVLMPDGALEASDFETLTNHVDAYLEQNGMLHGVMIRAQAFPGWKDFGALLAHLKFVKRHHQQIEKVAVVADGAIATVMPHIASHFIHAEVKHFKHPDENAAWDWLLEHSRAQTRTAA